MRMRIVCLRLILNHREAKMGFGDNVPKRVWAAAQRPRPRRIKTAPKNFRLWALQKHSK